MLLKQKRIIKRMGTFYEVQVVKKDHEEAFKIASRDAISIPSTWTLSGQNPPYQSPRDITIMLK
jgi:hypothetical protein